MAPGGITTGSGSDPSPFHLNQIGMLGISLGQRGWVIPVRQHVDASPGIPALPIRPVPSTLRHGGDPSHDPFGHKGRNPNASSVIEHLHQVPLAPASSG